MTHTAYAIEAPAIGLVTKSGLSPLPWDTVIGTVNYVVKSDVKPVVYVAPPGTGDAKRTSTYAPTSVPIRDARSLSDAISLEYHGFELRHHHTSVSDLYDEEQVGRLYYPEMEHLVMQATGASKVLVFDHTIRTTQDPDDKNHRMPVRVVHNDYTETSAPKRARDLLGDEAEALLERRRLAVVNVWRPIKGPVTQMPLALVNAQSVARADLVATELKYTDRSGEIYEVAANAGHQWFYFPQMERDEVLLIKGYDSMEDGRARFTPHTAFDDPTSPPHARARESIEVRALAFF